MTLICSALDTSIIHYAFVNQSIDYFDELYLFKF